MFNLHVCLCWHLALWPLGVFRCWRLPRNTHRCLRAIYMRSINPPKIEDLSRSTTLMQGIASLKLHTVPDVGDVRGVAVSAVTGKLYVAYRNNAGVRDDATKTPKYLTPA